MINLAKSIVDFNAKEHKYLLGGTELSGITSMLSRQLFTSKYDNVSKDDLEIAAERGHLIHARIEMCDNSGFDLDTPEVTAYYKLMRAKGLKSLCNEYLVSDNENFASSIDIVCEDLSLIDIKCTSVLDKEYLSWQLSIYKYLFELQNPNLKVNKLYAVWLPRAKYGSPRIVEIQEKPKEEVVKLMQCDVNGDKYSPIERTPNIAVLEGNIQDKIIELDNNIKILERERKLVQNRLTEFMRVHGVESLKSDKLKISYTAPYAHIDFDLKAFQSENPTLYNKYTKVTAVKDSVRILTAK